MGKVSVNHASVSYLWKLVGDASSKITARTLPLRPHAVPSRKSEKVGPGGFGDCFYMLFTNLMLVSLFLLTKLIF